MVEAGVEFHVCKYFLVSTFALFSFSASANPAWSPQIICDSSGNWMCAFVSASMALAYPEVPAVVLGGYSVPWRHRALGFYFRVAFEIHWLAGFQNQDSTRTAHLYHPGRYLRVGVPGDFGGPCPEIADSRRLSQQH